MRHFAKKITKEASTQLPADHKCHGCVWANVHDNKVVCVRLPCIKRKRQV